MIAALLDDVCAAAWLDLTPTGPERLTVLFSEQAAGFGAWTGAG